MGQIQSMAVRGECEPTPRGQSCVSRAATAFLRPRSVSRGQDLSIQRNPKSLISPVRSENSVSSNSSSTPNYCSSNEDDASVDDEMSRFAPSFPQLKNEADNSTDAAASVLLMLSRS